MAATEDLDQVDQNDILLTEAVLGYDIRLQESCVGAIEGKPGEINYLLVEPPWEGNGIARAALNKFISLSRSYGASEVITSNVIHPAMKHILETEGFEERSDDIGWVKEFR
ncbi:GNAT family N-acetyltransferase [Halopenitus salinus]|uniref:GNAT family N-acetyltransferase n=1 Tax=Halopenitus salinus TaxID=1198295 RepID=A0ABD5V1J5_9EURY